MNFKEKSFPFNKNESTLTNTDKIPFPTEEEKNKSIAFIIEQGFHHPCHLREAIPILWREVGIQGLFFGVGDCVFLSFLSAMLLWIGIFASARQDLTTFYLFDFLLSPFLYAVLHLLTVWKDIMVGTYEQFMTFRISLRQMTILRMFVFGGISVMLSVGISWISWLLFIRTASLLRILSLSFAALFLFAWMELLIEWKWRAPISYFIVPIIWIGLGIFLLSFGKYVQKILLAIPVVVFFALALAFAICYFFTLEKYYFDFKEGGLHHAVD